MHTLLSIASRQVWPQILAVAHLRPRRLLLLHSDEAAESRQPARRLQKFFRRTDIAPDLEVRLAPIPHDDVDGIQAALDQASIMPPAAANITGGNKLMATALFHWAAARGIEAFYLERTFQAIWLTAGPNRLTSRRQDFDRSLLDPVDPLDVIRCQLDGSEVERAGQRLTLNDQGRALSPEQARGWLREGRDPRHALTPDGDADPVDKEGDDLEYRAAFALLTLGVRQVRRSLRLKVKSSPGLSVSEPHGEIDLVFNFGGQLWIVDCKDRRSTDWLVEKIRQAFAKEPPVANRLEGAVSQSEYKAIKDDLVAARETGGLSARILCVRRTPLDDVSREYARRNGVELVEADGLLDDLRPILFPDARPTAGDLASLQRQFN